MPIASRRTSRLAAVWIAAGVFVLGIAADGETCTASTGSPVNFGSKTSFVVQSTVQSSSSSNIGLTCQPPILSLLSSGDHITATISSANSGLRGPSGDVVAYSMYADSGWTIPLQPGVPTNYLAPTMLDLLGLLGGSPVVFPLFVLTTPGSNVAQGAYADTLTINWTWSYCLVKLLGACVLPVQGSGTSTVQMTMTVTAACQVTASPDITFGQAPMAGAFPSVVQSIVVLCTKDLDPYNVGLGNGLHASGGRRNMAKGGDRLQYDIFKGATTEVWTADGAGRYANTAPASGSTPAIFTYTAAIYADQPTPPIGHYADSIVVDVSF